jgi:hypothetical protein
LDPSTDVEQSEQIVPPSVPIPTPEPAARPIPVKRDIAVQVAPSLGDLRAGRASGSGRFALPTANGEGAVVIDDSRDERRGRAFVYERDAEGNLQLTVIPSDWVERADHEPADDEKASDSPSEK